MRKIKDNNSGFIALMSAIIISAVLLLIVVNISSASLFTRSNILDYELKEKSAALAEGCGEVAMLKLIQNSGYRGDETIEVGENTCEIESVSSNGSEKIIHVKADYKHYIAEFKITLNSADMSIVSYESI